VDKPHWYLEASQERCQINTQNKAIGRGLFFNRHPYDYTNEEFNLPQGHEIASAQAICFPSTEPVTRKMMTILFFHLIGWSIQANCTVRWIKLLAPRLGNVL
jgi:hypothetical protein